MAPGRDFSCRRYLDASFRPELRKSEFIVEALECDYDSHPDLDAFEPTIYDVAHVARSLIQLYLCHGIGGFVSGDVLLTKDDKRRHGALATEPLPFESSSETVVADICRRPVDCSAILALGHTKFASLSVLVERCIRSRDVRARPLFC